MLLGLIRPTSGGGSILGGSLRDPASYLHKVGALIESPAFYPQLSGRDNLKALTRLGQIPSAAIDPALERTGMTARAGDKYRAYSLGMKQRLGIAAALLPSPELLILDEQANGLDPGGIVEMRGLIRSFADDGITVLVSSHLISEIEQVCDHVVMIRGGRLVHQGPMAEPRRDSARTSWSRPSTPPTLSISRGSCTPAASRWRPARPTARPSSRPRTPAPPS